VTADHALGQIRTATAEKQYALSSPFVCRQHKWRCLLPASSTILPAPEVPFWCLQHSMQTLCILQKESADIIHLANSRRESRHLAPWKQQAAEQRAHPAGRSQLATPQPLQAWLHPCWPGPPCLPPSHPGWAGAGLRAGLGAAQAH